MEQLTEIHKLKNYEYNLNKNINDLLKQLSKYEDTSHLTDVKIENDRIRARDSDLQHNDLRNIYKPLNKIHTLMNDEYQVNNIDLSSLKKDMINIQDNINKVKYSNKTNLEKLKKEEDELQNDIDIFKEKIDANYKKINLFPTPNRVPTLENSNLCSEVQEYKKFVSDSGGHENRWPLDDHNLFLKLRNKHKNETDLAKNLHKQLPDISEQAVIRHEMWYREYLRLKQKQQEAIKKWRQSRVKEVINEKNNCDSPPKVESKVTTIINRDVVKHQLVAWKEEKDRKLKEISKEKRREVQRRRESDIKLKERQLELKKQIELWKMNKEMVKKKEQLQKEREALVMKELKSSKANELIKVFQLQDKIYMDKLKSKKLRSNSLDRSEHVNKPIIERDPSRLLKPTKQWLHRTSSLDENSTRNICFINSVQKLGVPEWRKAIK